jgi:hypothetical protein
MNLIDKYLGEAKYIPNMKYDPSNYGKELSGDDLVAMAKLFKGKQQEITANIGWAMKKNDKKKVKALIDKFGEHIIGGQGTVNQLMDWIRRQ